jgi:ankyrin repeat protein
MLVAENGHVDCLKLLIQAGANLDMVHPQVIIIYYHCALLSLFKSTIRIQCLRQGRQSMMNAETVAAISRSLYDHDLEPDMLQEILHNNREHVEEFIDWSFIDDIDDGTVN